MMMRNPYVQIVLWCIGLVITAGCVLLVWSVLLPVLTFALLPAFDAFGIGVLIIAFGAMVLGHRWYYGRPGMAGVVLFVALVLSVLVGLIVGFQ
jgi:hypothetical protein